MTALIAELKSLLQQKQTLELTMWRSEDDEEGVTFQTVIERIIDGRYLVAPAPSVFLKFKDILKPPVIVGALYGEGPAPFIFYPTLDELEVIKAKGFWLSLPDNMQIETIQRRAFVRVKTRQPVILENDPEMPAYTVDISGGGMQFVSAQHFIPGTILKAKVHFQTLPPSPPPSNWIQAQVVQCRENPMTKRTEEAFATSCQFVGLSEQDQKILMGECFRIELKGKKHLQG